MPLSVLWTEAEFVRNRIRERISTETILIQVAIVDALAGGGEHLKSALRALNDE